MADFRNAHARMKNARKWKDIYTKTEDDYGSIHNLSFAGQKRRNQMQLNATLRGMGIFGSASVMGVMGGTTAVLRPTMYANTAMIRKTLGAMKPIIQSIVEQEEEIIQPPTVIRARTKKPPKSKGSTYAKKGVAAVKAATSSPAASLDIEGGKYKAKESAYTGINQYIIRSSWVNALGYHRPSQILYAQLGDNDFYWKVPEHVFAIWKAAASKCKTTDKRDPPRWRENKSRSLGATFWDILGKYLWGNSI